MRTLFFFFLFFFSFSNRGIAVERCRQNVFTASMVKNSVVLAGRLLSVTFTRGRAIRNGFATRVSQTYNRGKPSRLRGSVKCSTNTRRVCRHLTAKFDYLFLPSAPLLPPLSVVERCVDWRKSSPYPSFACNATTYEKSWRLSRLSRCNLPRLCPRSET